MYSKAADETGLTEEQVQSFTGQLNRKGKNSERRQPYPSNRKASSEMGDMYRLFRSRFMSEKDQSDKKSVQKLTGKMSTKW